MTELEIDQSHLPRVQEVCQGFAVLEDGALAHNLQEQEIEQYYASNVQKNQLVQRDVRIAKRLQDEEDQRRRLTACRRQIKRTAGPSSSEQAVSQLCRLLYSKRTAGPSSSEQAVSELCLLLYCKRTAGPSSSEQAVSELCRLLYSKRTAGPSSSEQAVSQLCRLLYSKRTAGPSSSEQAVSQLCLEQYYASNVQKNQLVQRDVRIAKRLQDEEDQRRRLTACRRQIEEQDSEYAQTIQEDIRRRAEEARRREEQDEEIAKKLQEEEELEIRRRRLDSGCQGNQTGLLSNRGLRWEDRQAGQSLEPLPPPSLHLQSKAPDDNAAFPAGSASNGLLSQRAPDPTVIRLDQPKVWRAA
ncbi:Coiled-coil domain-containing protein 50 [Acipenser ruthenus]|uniref:Coiled-coil domain-containing protein 50 n=1 Tax=Acipenser ruthenus TaxID=7906 RepID=A0A444V469_ACIRT|nr:Coiled-coil domain-containing protein 50 [Acipenser ruthenus]